MVPHQTEPEEALKEILYGCVENQWVHVLEIRKYFLSDITRVLYFFFRHYEGKIIMTNGFVKRHKNSKRGDTDCKKAEKRFHRKG